MKMNYIRIRGSIGIKKGLGLDEIEFDLSGKNGLVALAGPNGRGKTTVLELMSVFRTLASRKGALKHHFFLRDSLVEKKFSYNGDEYHIIWKIDSGSDRSESFITVNGESVVDGKNTEYDKYIIDKFGSQNLFYNSVFCAQNSENMSDMTAGKIKELFVEFLQIGRLEEYRKVSKDGVDFYQRKIDKISGEIEMFQSELDGYSDIESEIKHRTENISAKEDIIYDAGKEIEKYSLNIKDLEIKKEAQKSDLVRKKEIQSELTRLIPERDDIKNKQKNNAGEFHSKKMGIEDDIVKNDSILELKEDVLNASSRIKNLEKWGKYFLGCFECSIDEQAGIDKNLKELDSSKEHLNQKKYDLENDTVLDGLKTTLKYLESKKFEIDSNHSILLDKLSNAENDFALVQAKNEVVSCREKIAMAIDPDCTSTTCPAIEMVSKAKNDLPMLEKKESDLVKENEKLKLEIGSSISLSAVNIIDVEEGLMNCSITYESLLDKITIDIDGIKTEIAALDIRKSKLLSDYLVVDEFKGYYKARLNSTREKIENLKELAAKKTEIEIAEDRKKTFEKELAGLIESFEKLKIELSDKFDKKCAEILSKENSILMIDGGIDADIDNKIVAIEKQKNLMASFKSSIEKELSLLKNDLAVLQNNLKKRDNVSASLKEKKDTEKVYKKESSDWDYLKLACSKNGLQALEIDGAVPLIVSEANTLLEKAFGLDSQIRILTVDPETGKEVFQIKVIRDDGSEDDYSNLSGGQKVWIAEAISKGMTLVSKKKSGRNFETLFSDENDGALDSEKAVEFIKMYQAMMSAGDFSTYFFISHNSDVVGMADDQIQF